MQMLWAGHRAVTQQPSDAGSDYLWRECYIESMFGHNRNLTPHVLAPETTNWNETPGLPLVLLEAK